MKPIKLLIAFMLFYMHANTQAPSLSFDPISVKTITVPGWVGAGDAAGNLYFSANNRVSRFSPGGTTTIIAGTGNAGYVDGPAANAQFSGIADLARDAQGNIYVADYNNNSIRKITPGGTVSTLAGNGEAGNQDGAGTAARFNGPQSIVVDVAGYVYVADVGNQRICKITPAGIVSTLVHDLSGVSNIAIDPFGNLYADPIYGPLTKISPEGVVSSVFPPAFYGFKTGITADRQGNLYVGVTNYNSTISAIVYKIFPGGNAVPLAGNIAGNADGIGTDAQFSNIRSLTIDEQGNIYAADGNGNRKLSKPALSFAGNAGAPSPAKYFSISANYLNGPASLQAPAGYELSLNEAGPYSPALTVTSAGGEIQVVKIFIRLAASVAPGVYNDSVVLSANGAIAQKLGVSGVVTNSPKKLVIIGSGTSACIGLNPGTECYVGRLNAAYNKLAPPDTTINNSLARGSTNCYNGMPSSYVSPYPAGSGYSPVTDINITAALALHPDAVLVNYPSNGYDVLSVNEIMFCLRTIRDSANKQGVPCYFTTTQPRTSPASFNTTAMKLKLASLKDSILATFGPFAIDFWTGLINPADSSVLYDQGDRTNMTAAGHAILFQRVLAKNVFAIPAGSIGAGTGLLASYYPGNPGYFYGAPFITRVEPVINNDLKSVPPVPGMDANYYSVRWTGQVQPIFSGVYTFYTVADDGVRLWVNGVQLVDNWVQQGATEKSGSITLVAGQKYDIVMEYFQVAGDAVSKLLWSGPGTAKNIIPAGQLYPAPPALPKPPACAMNIAPANGTTITTATTAALSWKPVTGATDYNIFIWKDGEVQPNFPSGYSITASYTATNLSAGTLYHWYILPENGTFNAVGCGATNTTTFRTAATEGSGTGLQGVYYSGVNLTGNPLLTRIDPTINFELTYTHPPLSPAPGIVPEDNYSVRWTGQVQAQYSEAYTFHTLSDDGIRLWVNGVKLVDNWTNHGATENSGTIALIAGQKYDIVIEYYEGTGEAITKLYWSGLSTPKAIVPKAQLYPPASTARFADNSLALQKAPVIEDASAFAFTTARLNPNPVKRGQPARLQINSSRTGEAVVTVMSSNGSNISNQRINMVKGINTTAINTGTLAQGLYLISITGGDKPITVKMVVD